MSLTVCREKATKSGGNSPQLCPGAAKRGNLLRRLPKGLLWALRLSQFVITAPNSPPPPGPGVKKVSARVGGGGVLEPLFQAPFQGSHDGDPPRADGGGGGGSLSSEV